MTHYIPATSTPRATRRRWARPFRCHLCRGRYTNPLSHVCKASRTARLYR